MPTGTGELIARLMYEPVGDFSAGLPIAALLIRGLPLLGLQGRNDDVAKSGSRRGTDRRPG
jgi:hypothetical protein